MKKIGILTSGGDCQGLNAAIRGVAKGLYEEIDDVEIYGIQNGYAGLIHGDYKKMNQSDFSGILTIGGTILGTSRQPFKMMRVIEDENSIDKVAAMKDNYKKMGLDCLVILGGNGTHKTANLLSEEGLNVVTMPKTIDNDVWGTEMTFGFQSAVDIATEVIDCIHTTATSHGRIFIVEVMGHKVGWLNLYAGIAGGADIILLPEIPYDINEIAKVIEKREQAGKRFSILAVAEGAISKEEAKMKKKELKALRASMPYPSISYKIAKELEEVTGHEIRVTVPGHFQRGGSPCAYDRFLCTRFGAAAARLIKNEQYGFMVALQNEKIVPVPLGEVAGKLKKVPVDSDIIEAAKESDIPIIFFNREPVAEDLNQWEKLYYVGAKAKQSGVMQGELAADLIWERKTVDRNKDGKIQYVVLEGEMGHQDAIVRTESAVDSLKEKGVELEKLSYEIANWNRAQAQNRMTQMINQYNNQIELVLANNDDMALGAIDAYEKLGYTETDIPAFLGIDGTDEGLEAVLEEKMAATVYNDKEAQANAMAQLARQLVTGEKMKKVEFENQRYIYLPYEKVTKDNVQDFLK